MNCHKHLNTASVVKCAVCNRQLCQSCIHYYDRSAYQYFCQPCQKNEVSKRNLNRLATILGYIAVAIIGYFTGGLMMLKFLNNGHPEQLTWMTPGKLIQGKCIIAFGILVIWIGYNDLEKIRIVKLIKILPSWFPLSQFVNRFLQWYIGGLLLFPYLMFTMIRDYIKDRKSLVGK